MKEVYGITDVGKWARNRRRYWSDRVVLMDHKRLGKIATTGKPDGL